MKNIRIFSALLLQLALPATALATGQEYYDHTTYPSQGAAGSSSAMRAELDLIETGFGKLPTLSGNGSKVVAINSGATALEAITTTGTGSGVRATSPTLVTPVLGVATVTSINKVAITAPATSATLTVADGKTLTSSNTLTFAGTDGSTLNVGTGGTLGTAAYTASSAYATTANKLSDFASTTSSELAGVISNETGTGVLVFGTSPTVTTDLTVTRASASTDLNINSTGGTGNNYAWRSHSDGRFILLDVTAGSLARVEIAPTTGAFTFNTAVTADAIVTANAGLKFPATFAASSDANTMDDYQESGSGTTVTLTGCSSGTTGTAHWTKIGNVVTLSMPTLTCTSDATTKTITGLPAELGPTTKKIGVTLIGNNGSTEVAARFDVETTGVLTLYSSAAGAAFTASGAMVILATSFTYTLK